MDSSKNLRLIIPFKKFDMVARVKKGFIHTVPIN